MPEAGKLTAKWLILHRRAPDILLAGAHKSGEVKGLTRGRERVMNGAGRLLSG